MPKRIDNRCETHGSAGMTRISLLNGVDRESADSIDTQKIKVGLGHDFSNAGQGVPAERIQG